MYFFFHENMPRRIVRALAALDVPCTHLLDRYPKSGRVAVRDEDWIPDVASKGWIAVTLDRRIYRQSDQYLIACREGLRSVVLTPGWGSMRLFEKAGRLIRYWPSVREQARVLASGDAVRLSPGGEFSLIE